MSLRDTVDNSYLEMFFFTWAMVWEGNLHLGEGWLYTNAVILRHTAALFPWGGCTSESLMSLLTAWGKVCSSFDREVWYLPRPYGQSLLTFNTSTLYFSSWRVSQRNFVLLSLAIPQSPSLFLSLLSVWKILFASWIDFQLEGTYSWFIVSYVADEPSKEQEISLQGLAVSLLGLTYCSVCSKTSC